MVVWKFTLRVEDEQVVQMPAGAKILTVQTQDGQPRIWALIDPASLDDLPAERRVIVTHGTGHVAEGGLTYLGTYQLHDGAFVGHVFEQAS